MMPTVGVAVEGPSDQRFWKKVLHRKFPCVGFHVQQMNNRPNLIRSSARLLEAFRGAHFVAGVLILDMDKEPCASSVIDLFDPPTADALRQPLDGRYLYLAAAKRKVECWYLADVEATCEVLGCPTYEIPDDTGAWGRGKLEALCRSVGVSYRVVDFAERIAPKFSIERAKGSSSSFRCAWDRIERAVERARCVGHGDA